jgi:heme-degrading monooxygenase HmoA
MSVVVIFTSTRTASHDVEYAAMAARMEELARQQPGFLDVVSVRDPDTRRGITVARFRDEDSVQAWRRHPEHLEAQRRGIEAFYEEYHVSVMRVEREYGHRA